MQSQYEAHKQQLSQESTSLHNETLSSIKSNSDMFIAQEDDLKYNQYSVIEINRSKSAGYIQENCKLKSLHYRWGVQFLSPVKIYSLLYLGLLIINDKLKLSDLLKLIWEGHLNFNKYRDLFPEEYNDKLLNIMNNSRSMMYTADCLRRYTAKLAKFLDVTKFIVVPDCVELCQKFCKELNLPGMDILFYSMIFE